MRVIPRLTNKLQQLINDNPQISIIILAYNQIVPVLYRTGRLSEKVN